MRTGKFHELKVYFVGMTTLMILALTVSMNRLKVENLNLANHSKKIAEIIFNKEFLPIDICYEIRLSDIKECYKYVLP